MVLSRASKRARAFSLNGIPYSIHFFLIGDEAQSAELKPSQEVLTPRVGALSIAADSPSVVLCNKDYVYNFSTPFGPDPTFRGCVNCKTKATEDTRSTEQVPITGTLLARIATGYAGAAGSIMDESNIVALLKEKLTRRVITDGGYEVSIPQDPADTFLEVSVAVGKRYFASPAPGAEPQLPGFTVRKRCWMLPMARRVVSNIPSELL